MLKNKVKKFYKTVRSISRTDGEIVFLDGKIIRTPEMRDLVLPYKALTKGIVKEWSTQGIHIDLKAMPLTRLSFTAIDKIRPDRLNSIKHILKWASSDLLCYRVNNNKDLLAFQKSRWDRHLDWLRSSYGVELKTTFELAYLSQPNNTLERLYMLLNEYDDFRLLAFNELVQILGSFILTLRVVVGDLDWKIAFQDSILDEEWQMNKWGYELETVNRNKNILLEVKVIKKFLNLLHN